MRSGLIAAAAVSAAMIWRGGIALAGPATNSGITIYGNAPIGHLQPRAPGFAPDSSGNQAEQQNMSKFDTEQQKLDKELDKRLNICRC